jgi:hypothetical protein
MTRRSKRELERALEELTDAPDDTGEAVRIQYDVVGADGTTVGSFERVFSVDR